MEEDKQIRFISEPQVWRDRRAFIMTAAAASMAAAASGCTPIVRLSSEARANFTPAAETIRSTPVTDNLFKEPYMHSLFNANLARIRVYDPTNPQNSPDTIRYEGNGVRAEIVITGIAATKSISDLGMGYGNPNVSVLMDIFVLGDDHEDGLVLATIAAPFAAGTTGSHDVTVYHKHSADLLGKISSHVMDQVEISALVSAMNDAGNESHQEAVVDYYIHNTIFPSFDKAIRTTVGRDINKELATIVIPVPLS